MFFKPHILLVIDGRKFGVFEMVMNDYCNIFYGAVLFLQCSLQAFHAHINLILVVASVLENRSVFHNYIDSFKAVGEKFLPEIDLLFFLRREDRTQHQQGNYAHNEDFCSHLHLPRFNYNIGSHFVKGENIVNYPQKVPQILYERLMVASLVSKPAYPYGFIVTCGLLQG